MSSVLSDARLAVGRVVAVVGEMGDNGTYSCSELIVMFLTGARKVQQALTMRFYSFIPFCRC